MPSESGATSRRRRSLKKFMFSIFHWHV
jgi:hypothetical protein